ncbi:MAG: phosphopentomutase [Deltaproteobacteria bacterium]|nr:phosphopentomutase [Deltaproteobacteria bacterium]
MKTNRITIIVLDSVGIGAAPDAHEYGDVGTDTLGHIAQARGGLHLPNLGRLGLGNIRPLDGVAPTLHPTGAFGKMQEISVGKDTLVGHWELAGLPTHEPLGQWPNGFPEEIIAEVRAQTHHDVLGNKAASGTAIIEELGAQHMATGDLIVYTSADSVLQIAAHEEIVPIEELYKICRHMRMVGDRHRIGRIIARPFIGTVGAFTRTYNRRDFPMVPPGPTVLDVLVEAQLPVVAVGKIHDIFAGRGMTEAIHTKGNADGVSQTIRLLAEKQPAGLIFTNLVDFDMLYGHRNDAAGYGDALEAFDAALPDIEAAMGPDELLMITADHGNDPTTDGTDHSREYVPILLRGTGHLDAAVSGRNLGIRQGFADVAATLTAQLGLDPWPMGTPLL